MNLVIRRPHLVFYYTSPIFLVLLSLFSFGYFETVLNGTNENLNEVWNMGIAFTGAFLLLGLGYQLAGKRGEFNPNFTKIHTWGTLTIAPALVAIYSWIAVKYTGFAALFKWIDLRASLVLLLGALQVVYFINIFKALLRK